MEGVGCRDQGLGFKAEALGFGVQGPGSGVWSWKGLLFRGGGWGFRV